MNEALKIRLLGAAVLLIGLGLLWPLLFDFDEAMLPEFADLDMSNAEAAIERIEKLKAESKDRSESDPIQSAEQADDKLASSGSLDIATAPSSAEASNSRRILAPETTVELKPNNAPSSSTGNEQTSATEGRVVEALPQLDVQGIPIAYVVQLGTFSSWKNADQLRNQLTEQGYRAYVRPEASANPGPYRVQVGPVMTFELAEKLNGELQEHLSLKDTFIRRFAQK